MPNFPKDTGGKGGSGHYNNIKRVHNVAQTDTGQGGHRAAPNGGGTRLVDMPTSKMPRSKSAPVEQSGPLGIPTDKMPRTVKGARVNEPTRR